MHSRITQMLDEEIFGVKKPANVNFHWAYCPFCLGLGRTGARKSDPGKTKVCYNCLNTALMPIPLTEFY